MFFKEARVILRRGPSRAQEMLKLAIEKHMAEKLG
jgi:hypothetical protein